MQINARYIFDQRFHFVGKMTPISLGRELLATVLEPVPIPWLRLLQDLLGLIVPILRSQPQIPWRRNTIHYATGITPESNQGSIRSSHLVGSVLGTDAELYLY